MRGGEWFFKNSGSRKILVEFHGSRSLGFWAVMCVSQCRFWYEGVKHFEVSVSQSKKSKCLGLAEKNASLAVSQSLAFTIRHPYYDIQIEIVAWSVLAGFLVSAK